MLCTFYFHSGSYAGLEKLNSRSNYKQFLSSKIAFFKECMFDVFSFKENENIEKSNPDRAHGLFISLASKRNAWCNIDEFVPTICF
jgi:hypothetical protein